MANSGMRNPHRVEWDMRRARCRGRLARRVRERGPGKPTDGNIGRRPGRPHQFLSKKRTAQALAELFGTPVSEGTVAAVTRRAAAGLDEFLDVVADRIAESGVAGFDETGLRVAGELH